MHVVVIRCSCRCLVAAEHLMKELVKGSTDPIPISATRQLCVHYCNSVLKDMGAGENQMSEIFAI